MKIIFPFLMVLYLIIFNVYITEIMKITDSFLIFIGFGTREYGVASEHISFMLSMLWPFVLFLVFVLALISIPALIQIIKEKQMGN